MRMKQILTVAAALLSLNILQTSCRPKGSAKVKAIHLADKSVSLLPGRLFSPSGKGVAYQNSVRLMMLPVGCPPAQIRRLEQLVERNVETIRHNGPAIVGMDGRPIPGAESCSIFTNYAVHPWSFASLFEASIKNPQEFAKQQWFWLALRGRTAKQGYGFADGFDLWMAEAGIYASAPQAVVESSLAKWDTLYNPCQPVDTSKKLGFNKHEAFACVDGDYEPKADKLGTELINLINSSGAELLAAINAGEFKEFQTAGIETALMITNAPASNSGKSSLKLAAGKKFRPFGGFFANLLARSPANTSYQGRNPVQGSNYSSYRPPQQPPITYPPGTNFSYPDEPGSIYRQQDVTQLYRGQNYGLGAGYRTMRITSPTGQEQYVDVFSQANGGSKNVYWTRDPKLGWVQGATTVGTVDGIDRSNTTVSRDYPGWKQTPVTPELTQAFGQGNQTADNYKAGMTTTMFTRGGETFYLDQKRDGSGDWYTKNPNGDWELKRSFGADNRRTGGTSNWNEARTTFEPATKNNEPATLTAAEMKANQATDEYFKTEAGVLESTPSAEYIADKDNPEVQATRIQEGGLFDSSSNASPDFIDTGFGDTQNSNPDEDPCATQYCGD